MEVTIKGKVYTNISTLHMTGAGGKETGGVHHACFIVYDEYVDGEFVTHVLYFDEMDLEDIKVLPVSITIYKT